MATIIGAVAASHTPTIGFAYDRNKQNDPVWKPIFEAFKPVQRWLAEQKPDVVLVRGINTKIYYVGLVLMALIGLAIAGLIVRGLLVGQFVAVLFLVGFGALFGWQIGGFLRRNAPGRYALDALPPDLLP